MKEHTPQGSVPPVTIQIQIELDAETAQGMYVNMAMVNHSEGEFTMDFIYVQPQQPKAKVRARVITNPKHMKRLLMAAQDAVAQFEKKFGAIDVTGPAMQGQILN